MAIDGKLIVGRKKKEKEDSAQQQLATGEEREEGEDDRDDGVFSVEDGLITASNMRLTNLLDVEGSVVIDDSLTIGAGMMLSPTGMSVDIDKHTGTLLDLRSRSSSFNGSLFELHTFSESTTIMKTVSQGMTTFELLSNGTVKMKGLRMLSGGIDIENGGLAIHAGGIRIAGGISLESGSLDMKSNKMILGSIELKSKGKMLVGFSSSFSLLSLFCLSSFYFLPKTMILFLL
jgi:hypothetical protein